MSDNQTVETGTTGEQEDSDDGSSESIAELSDEELLAALGEATPESDTATGNPPPEQGKTDLAPPASPAAPATDPPFVKAEELPAKPTDEEYEQIKLRLENQRKFLERRSQEVGELRKQNKNLIAQLQAKATELELDNPREAARYDRAIEEATDRDRHLAEQQSEAVRLHEAVTIVPKYVTPEEFNIEDMVLELKEDGVINPEFIERFKQNPYKTQYPETLIHLAKRAHYGKHLRTLIPLTKALYEENQKLKGKVKTKGEDVMRGIQKAVKSAPALTTNGSAADTASSNGSMSAVDDPSLLSDAELEAFLKRAGSNG